MVKRIEVEERQQTLGSQIDRVGIESGVALGGGKAQEERGKEESEGQHVDLVALFRDLIREEGLTRV